MASVSLSLSFGQTEFQIVEGTSAPGAGNVELRIDLATIPTISGGSGAGNVRVQDILDMFKNYLSGKGLKVG
jgi:hypothetical protein